MAGTVAERLAAVRAGIAAAAERAGRDPAEVTLIAVGKGHPAELVLEAIRSGVTDLGENRVQEAVGKRPLLPVARWHLIGPLQGNKARLALETFDLLQTVDRLDLVERLERLLAERFPTRRLPVLIEVNIGRETQKSGALPEQTEALLAETAARPRLQPLGLMAIPPFHPDPEASRSHFRALHALRERLRDRLGLLLPHLSMGMSLDYEIAVAEGATLVRIGTAIFGERD